MAAHDAIVGKAKRERKLAGMGTTVTAVALVAGYWVLAHIGDSRAYLLRDGRLTRMTQDHSYVQHLIDTGRISPAEARNHPQRNVVMRVLGDFDIDPHPDIAIRAAHPTDRWMLCSDGLCGVLEDSTIEQTLMPSPCPTRPHWSPERRAPAWSPSQTSSTSLSPPRPCCATRTHRQRNAPPR